MTPDPQMQPHNFLSLRRGQLPYALSVLQPTERDKHVGLLVNRDYRPLFDQSRSFSDRSQLYDLAVRLKRHPASFDDVWHNQQELHDGTTEFYFYDDGEQSDVDLILHRYAKFLRYVKNKQHWSERRS